MLCGAGSGIRSNGSREELRGGYQEMVQQT
jgi:hypothetical protein